jgi:diacylglycerol kinase family enzyme
MVRKVIIVASPKAGSGARREQLPILAKALERRGIQVTQTSSIDKMKQLLANGPSQQTLPFGSVVVPAGGDGTLALVADHVDPNLLARYFGYQASATCMVDAICQGNSYRIDAGRANGKLFLVMASCGFDAEVVRGLHLRRRGHINRFSYARPIWRALRRYRFPDITVIADGKSVRQSQDASTPKVERPGTFGWVMVFNLPRYGGGLMIEPDAVATDGQLDMIAFSKRSIVSGVKYFGGILTGLHRQFSDVVRQRGQAIEIRSGQRVPYQLDGDYAGRLPLRIETLPRRVHLLLPVLASDPKGH